MPSDGLASPQPGLSQSWAALDVRRLRELPAPARFGLTLVVVALAVALRWSLAARFGSNFPYVTLFPAVMVAAALFGRTAGLAATVATSVSAWAFFRTANGRFLEPDAASLAGLAVFVALSLAITFLADGLYRARSRLEQVESERAMLGHEFRAGGLFQTMQEGLAYQRLVLDERGEPRDVVFLRVNEAFERMTGVRDIEGRRATEFVPDLQVVQADALQAYARVVRTGRPERLEIFSHRVGAWFSVAIYRPHEGHFVTLSENVSERKATLKALEEEHERLARTLEERMEMESALRRAELQFRLTLDQAPIGIALVGLDGRFLRVNAAWCEITGYSAEELASLTFQDITVPEDLAADLELVGRLLRGEIPRYSLEKRYLHKRGHPVRIRLYVSLVRDGAGHPIHFISQIEDVTERETLRARLVQAERLEALGTLAQGVAHEVNNPLAALVANVEILARETRAPAQARTLDEWELEELLADSRTAAGRIRGIVRALGLFSGPEGQKPTELDVRAALDTTLTLLGSEISRRARLARRYEEVPTVRADESRLAQVFMNLLVNACQAIAPGAPERNEITVSTGTDRQGRAVVEIRDSGGGIPDDALPHIFEPFYTTRAVGDGSGLGLSVAHGIVAGLGGRIAAESTSGGAVFRVTLPPAGAEA